MLSFTRRGAHAFSSWCAGEDFSQTPAVQVASALNRVRESLLRQGSCMGDVFFVHLYLQDMRDFQSVNTAYCSCFGINPPSRACVQVDLSTLLPPAAMQEGDAPYPAVMLDCFAQIGSGASLLATQMGAACGILPSVRREVLHVRSLSEWAPVCIGPYSQANVSGGLIFVAGQIGLVPATMKMAVDARRSVRDTAILQLQFSLAHVAACLAALRSDISCTLAYTVYICAEAAGCAGCTEALQRMCEEAFPSSASPCSIFAVVPFLPKNAMVEVEVVACEGALKSRMGTQRGECQAFVHVSLLMSFRPVRKSH